MKACLSSSDCDVGIQRKVLSQSHSCGSSLLNFKVCSNAPYSYDLDSKGKFPRLAQHPEATSMVPAVLGLLVMNVLHSTSC